MASYILDSLLLREELFIYCMDWGGRTSLNKQADVMDGFDFHHIIAAGMLTTINSIINICSTRAVLQRY
jgi:hypothetical protein